jgi:hypothetical protein
MRLQAAEEEAAEPALPCNTLACLTAQSTPSKSR